MDEASGHCAGCARTIDEIVRWGRMPREERRAVLLAAAGRRAAREAQSRVSSGAGGGME